MRHSRITVAAAAALAATSLAGCSRLPDDPGPTEKDFAETPPVPSLSVSPPPAARGVPVTGCPTGAQVLAALRDASALATGRPGVAVPKPPVCAGVWAGAMATAPDADPLSVVLERRSGRLYVVVAGSAVCEDPRTARTPAAVRTAVGC